MKDQLTTRDKILPLLQYNTSLKRPRKIGAKELSEKVGNCQDHVRDVLRGLIREAIVYTSQVRTTGARMNYYWLKENR